MPEKSVLVRKGAAIVLSVVGTAGWHQFFTSTVVQIPEVIQESSFLLATLLIFTFGAHYEALKIWLLPIEYGSEDETIEQIHDDELEYGPGDKWEQENL